MNEYIPFTDEQKRRANAMDLEDYLLRRGERLLPSGREKRLASDRSITIRGSEWFDHEAQQGGRAIDFVRMHDGCSFQEAVTKLLNGEQGQMFQQTEKSGAAKDLCPAARPSQYAPGVRLPHATAAYRPGHHHLLRKIRNSL